MFKRYKVCRTPTSVLVRDTDKDSIVQMWSDGVFDGLAWELDPLDIKAAKDLCDRLNATQKSWWDRIKDI